ncbi:unnamed protein product, partial [Didymodactylos carnosus]
KRSTSTVRKELVQHNTEEKKNSSTVGSFQKPPAVQIFQSLTPEELLLLNTTTWSNRDENSVLNKLCGKLQIGKNDTNRRWILSV